MAHLVVDSVAKAFGTRRVLTAASLRAVPGELRVLFGRNGSGKSTLLKIAAGWLAADAGSITFEDTRLPRPTIGELVKAGVFFLPDYDLLSSSYTLGRQLGFFAALFGGGDIVQALDIVGLSGRAESPPHRLSGGERRRAELAAVLVRQPRCLLADEPFRGVPPKDVEYLVLALRQLCDRGCAIIVTGHDVPALMDVADHITWCVAGTTHELGPPAQARQHESFRRDYLGPARS